MGHVAVIVQDFYGLKSSGAAWHTHFAQSITDLVFKPTRADLEVWLCKQTQQDNTKYYEYFLVYVDECLVISEHPQIILDALHTEYRHRLKDIHSTHTRTISRSSNLQLDNKILMTKIIGIFPLNYIFQRYYLKSKNVLES